MKFKKIVVLATLLALALIGVLFGVGVMPWQSAALSVIGIQAVAIAISERQPALFVAALTAEQLKEFGEILVELKAQASDLLPSA